MGGHKLRGGGVRFSTEIEGGGGSFGNTIADMKKNNTL